MFSWASLEMKKKKKPVKEHNASPKFSKSGDLFNERFTKDKVKIKIMSNKLKSLKSKLTSVVFLTVPVHCLIQV